MYKINAGYCDKHIGSLFYYVIANSKKEAKSTFGGYVTWLKIFSVEKCGADEENLVHSHPEKFIIFK